RPAALAGMIAPQWYAAAKLRYGLAFDRLLPFGIAGLALVRRESISGDLGDSRWQAGYLFGAGLEYALTDTISIKAEYNYLTLGKVMGAYPLEFLQTRNFSTENVKLGRNLHF
ncbi:MAG: outer membrane protein, partial [Phreatobacter sp.]